MDKLKKILLVLFSSIFVLTGCSANDDNDISDENTDTSINEQIEDNESDESTDEEIDVDTEVDKDNIPKDDISENDNEDEEISNEKEVSFNISSLDVNSGEKIVLGSLKLDENKLVEEKVNLLINEISKLHFNNAPIKLDKIENNIAYIDLQEGENENYWSTGYFQGSTGGEITTYTLTESLLQRDYKGEWIDGVCFSYQGETGVEFDHISMDFFNGVIKR